MLIDALSAQPNPLFLIDLSLSNEECVGVVTQIMSSSPTPNTSVKAAPLSTSLSKRRQNPSSFPSIAALKFFRRQRPSQPSLPVEPYEVAPGIWSTDATARVFGYIDTDENRVKSTRVQSAGPDIQASSQKVKPKPVPVRGPLDERNETHVLEQCNTDNIRDKGKPPIRPKQERRDEQRLKRKGSQSTARRGRMRTVSRDDQLVERGANPRTGLVSPFVVSDNSEESRRSDYIGVGNVGNTGSAGQSPRTRTRSGKWKQDSLGWSLVESPLLSPIAQSMSDKMSQVVPLKQLEDQMLDGTDPKYMTDGEIKAYQEEIARVYRRGGGSIAMLDPNSLPSPRQWTPEGPSTPPTQYKIQRKAIGTGVAHKSYSGDTVVVNADYRAPSLPIPRKTFVKRQKVRILTPSNTPKGSSFESCANASKAMGTTDHFLGLGSRVTCNQTASATQSQSYLNTGQPHQRLQNGSNSDPSATPSDLPSGSPTLSQHLPSLQSLPSSHSANLRTSSYRRPTQLLPGKLRPMARQGRAAEDVCTTTFTTTSTNGPMWEQRPKLQRQEGKRLVPRVDHLLPGFETPQKGCLQASTLKNKPAYQSVLTSDTLSPLGLATGRRGAMGPMEKADPARDLSETRNQTKEPMPADCLSPPPCENQLRNRASPMHMIPRLSLVSANIARERIQRKQSGDGCTTTYGLLGKNPGAIPEIKMRPLADYKEQANQSAELTSSGDCRAWFAGQWAEVEEGSEHLDLTTLIREKTLARRRSDLRKEADVKLWFYPAEAWVEPLAKLSIIQQLLHQMIFHIARTLHCASPTLATLRTANARTRDQVRAMKDLALAAVYLLVLLSIFVFLKRVLVFVGQVLYWGWHPVQTILAILGWCIMG